MLINYETPVLRQCVIVVVANFSMLHIGIEVAWLSPALVKLRDANGTLLSHPITDEEASWIVSVVAISGFIATFFIGYMMDCLGRRWCFLLSAVPRLILTFFTIFATEVWMLIIIKLLTGVSTSISLSVVPTYASEIASREHRGALGTISQIFASIGMLIMLSVGPFVSYLTLNIVQCGVVLLTVIPQLFLPESPYFLYAQGHKEDSLKLFTFLRCSEELAIEGINEITVTQTKASKKELLKDLTIVKTILKSLFLSIGFQMVGYNVVSTYLQTIFESTKADVSPEVSSLIIGFIQLVGCLTAVLLTHKFGRKPILGTTLVGMAIGLIGLGVFFKLSELKIEQTGFINYLPLGSLILNVFCFNAGLGSIIWMLIAELFDGPARALGVTASVSLTAVFVFITTKFFTTVIATIGAAATYWFLSGNCIVLCLFVLYCIPETKGKTILEIQEALGRKYPR